MVTQFQIKILSTYIPKKIHKLFLLYVFSFY